MHLIRGRKTYFVAKDYYIAFSIVFRKTFRNKGLIITNYVCDNELLHGIKI